MERDSTGVLEGHSKVSWKVTDSKLLSKFTVRFEYGVIERKSMIL